MARIIINDLDGFYVSFLLSFRFVSEMMMMMMIDDDDDDDDV